LAIIHGVQRCGGESASLAWRSASHYSMTEEAKWPVGPLIYDEFGLQHVAHDLGADLAMTTPVPPSRGIGRSSYSRAAGTNIGVLVDREARVIRLVARVGEVTESQFSSPPAAARRRVRHARPVVDRLTDVDDGAADRDHDVQRQPPSAVSDTWYANNLSDGWLSVTVERWPPLSSATADARPTRRTSPHSGQRLRELGVTEDRIYLDHGLTGTNRARPGLDQALAALREGDTLVVPKLDRLARSVPDARDIGDGLAARGIKLSLGGQVYDPTDPTGKMFFNILATFAEIEVDLLRVRTREGMTVARA
jgi:Resolvase, N terminal domain